MIFENSYWYVPTKYLPALQAGTGPKPRVKTVIDQTVWHFQRCDGCYVTGISATNIGSGWAYMMMVGSATPGGIVKIGFQPLDSSSGGNQGSGAVTVGDGSFDGKIFVMQMTSGTTAMSVTHWAHMAPLRPSMPEWKSLPGYPDTGVEDLTGLQTPIV